ncbi:putative ribosome quality control (RQC) complex YloA/Tae2 family protein [Methanofollis sp. W23]|uniref:ribosome rescue protein RqcH n=1 Tax=Methanofollis sp. W23 TaxID=2817849 RepID=UPI001AE26B5B|nr:ribosome rescue protein RqcH [Methanofollis sp. W23]MBP2145664.1 putative ribosome quality control (RQC) complex YloA/Tae2 family protein [Methanofollis sp. W23]
MADQKGMSGIDVRAMTAELSEKLPLWVGKIYQYDATTLGIRINGEGGAKYQFFVEVGRRAHLVGALPEAPKFPLSYAMLLRKHLEGGRVIEVGQYGLQRIFYIDVGKKGGTLRLVFELFDDGNIILLDGEGVIIKPLWHHRFKDRAVVPGEVYALPEGTDCSGYDEEGFAAMLAASDRDLVRTLAVNCLLGGKYAEVICAAAGVDKNMPAPEADASAIYAAFHQTLATIEGDRHPVITDKGCWPVPGIGTEKKEYPSFNEALEAFYPTTAAEKKAEKKKPKLSREEVILRQQKAALKKFDGKIARAEKAIEAVYTHYTQVQEVIAVLDQVSKERSWQEIEAVLKESDLPAAQVVVAVHPADAAVDLDLEGVQVKVYVHESVEVNLQHYYDQIKKFKKKKQGALDAMARGVPKKKEKPKETFTLMKAKWFHRFRWFYTSDGVLVLGGRDASQNEELVKRYMEGKDTFVHADVHGGSVVIVKGETAHLEDEVAQFAASYSNAWKAGHFTADVYMARPDQVSKTPESGEYVARGAFIIRGERRYAHNVTLGAAIGVQFRPSVAVIGGPVEAIKQRAEHFIELTPGTFGPNDVARKAQRVLKEKVGEETWKSLRTALNTEAIAAFVPPGGTDIVGEE